MDSNSYKCAELADKIEKQGLCLICDYPDFYGRKDEQIVPPDTNIQRDLIVAALRAYGSHGPSLPLDTLMTARNALFAQHRPPAYVDDCETCQHLKTLDEVARTYATPKPLPEMVECGACKGSGNVLEDSGPLVRDQWRKCLYCCGTGEVQNK